MEHITAVFKTKDQLRSVMERLQEEIKQGCRIHGVDNTGRRGKSKEQLIYQWQKMGQETGNLIGKVIGLGVATGLQSLNLVAQALGRRVTTQRCHTSNCPSGTGIRQSDSEDAKVYRFTVEVDEQQARRVMEIMLDHGAQTITQEL